MNKYYFTFGFGTENGNKFKVFRTDTREEARRCMFIRYGRNWSMCYDESEWFDDWGTSQQEAYKLTEIK